MASNSKIMKPHNIHMSDDLWNRLKARAKAEQVSVADVVRDSCEFALNQGDRIDRESQP